jgi:glycine cleavage system H protein
MTVLLVLATFATFLTIDFIVRHREASRTPVLVLSGSEASIPPLAEPVWVAGYQVPDECRFHPGHTWARQISPEIALVGLDDFARQLLGRAEKMALPEIGSWVRQGAAALRLGQNGRTVDMVAPVEGEVVEVNRAVAAEPHLATDDPFGRGWLFKVRTTELSRGMQNLLSGSLARRFMEDSRERMQHSLMALSGTVLADGGEPVADFAKHLPDEDWQRLVREFLLT